jgi:hypothetical protein
MKNTILKKSKAYAAIAVFTLFTLPSLCFSQSGDLRFETGDLRQNSEFRIQNLDF